MAKGFSRTPIFTAVPVHRHSKFGPCVQDPMNSFTIRPNELRRVGFNDIFNHSNRDIQVRVSTHSWTLLTSASVAIHFSPRPTLSFSSSITPSSLVPSRVAGDAPADAVIQPAPQYG